MKKIKNIIIFHLKKIDDDHTLILVDLVILIYLLLIIKAFLADWKIGAMLLSIPIMGLAWFLVITERGHETDQPDWWQKFISSWVGRIIMIIAGLIVIASIIFFQLPPEY